MGTLVRCRPAFCGLLALWVTGCPQFSSDDWHVAADASSMSDGGSIEDAGATSVPDVASAIEADSSEAQVSDAAIDAAAGQVDSAADAPGPASDAIDEGGADASQCTPVVWSAPADGSTQGPFAGCPLIGDPAPNVPVFTAEIILRAGGGCALTTTPAACRCAETYNCACLQAHQTFCPNDWVSCDDNLGAPSVTCQ